MLMEKLALDLYSSGRQAISRSSPDSFYQYHSFMLSMVPPLKPFGQNIDPNEENYSSHLKKSKCRRGKISQKFEPLEKVDELRTGAVFILITPRYRV